MHNNGVSSVGTTVCFIGVDQEDLSVFEVVHQQILHLHRTGINVHISLNMTDFFNKFIHSEENTIQFKNELEVSKFEKYKILKTLRIRKIPLIKISVDNQ